jgi:hypothetical protein
MARFWTRAIRNEMRPLSALDELFAVLDNRFGGCMVASSSSAPPLWGLWHPAQEREAEKDYLTTAEVLANPIPTDSLPG